MMMGACSSGSETPAANEAVANAAAPVAVDGSAPPAETVAAGGAIADGSYSCNKISGSMLVNMGTVRVSGGQPDTNFLTSVGATYKGVEPTAEGFRLNYTSKSGWAEVMDCERG